MEKRFITKEGFEIDRPVKGLICMDTKTGVNYLIVMYLPNSLSITPLLDSNGKVVVSKIDSTN